MPKKRLCGGAPVASDQKIKACRSAPSNQLYGEI
jgi:hypothetical protein